MLFSRRGLPVGGKNGFALLFLLIVVALTTLPRISATAAPECSTDDGADADADSASSCSPSTSHSEHAYFDDASSKEGIKFLKNKIFGQKTIEEEESSFSSLGGHAAAPEDDGPNNSKNKKEGKKEEVPKESFLVKLKSMIESDNPQEELLQFALSSSSSEGDDEDPATLDVKAMNELLKEVRDQIGRNLGDLIGDLVKEHGEAHNIPALAYYLRLDEERKNGAWKRRQHQYFEKLEGGVAELKELNKALYLSSLAYADTEEEILEGLKTFDGNAWQLFYCDTQGNPMEPAHFLAIRKQAAQLKTKTDKKDQKKKPLWQRPGKAEQEEQVLEVALVVRGTKSIGDVLSDLLFEPMEYRGGLAHSGLLESGRYIVDKHLERLRLLLEASGGTKLKLWVFGHSLGAGTAAIAAMEFNDHAASFNMEVSCVGFGGPSSVSPELSERYKDIITTVVSDADIIPRFSVSSIANLKLETMKFDFTGMALDDLDLRLENLTKDATFGKQKIQGVQEKVKKTLKNHFDSKVIPDIKHAAAKITEALPDGIPMDLIPPGTCIHLYRNGVGYDARYTPCSFFSEIEFVPHCVADHMVETGYNWALLSLLRQEEEDHHAVFPK
jgi:hypothetical protein